MVAPVALSLIVPAFEEAERLPATLRHAAEALPRLASESEIIVVDDGSRDATASVAERFASPVALRVIRLPENRGKGAAVAAGIAAARHPYVAFTDADCPYDLEQLRPMLAALVDGTADVAIGARELEESEINRGYGALRLLSGRTLSVLTSRVKIGRALRRRGLMLTPEESHEPRVLREARRAGAAAAERLATLREAVADRVVQQRVVAALPPSAPPRAAKAEAEAARIERVRRDGPDALLADDGLRLLSSRSAIAVLHDEVVAGRAHVGWGEAAHELVEDRDPPFAPIVPRDAVDPAREHAAESL